MPKQPNTDKETNAGKAIDWDKDLNTAKNTEKILASQPPTSAKKQGDNPDSRAIELEKKAQSADEYLDQLQRMQAEYRNYRKRVVKDKEEFRKYVLEGFLYKLLDVADNIQRAISASKQKHNYNSLLEGIDIVEKQFLDILKSHGAIPLIIKLGDKFNPNSHHAVSHEPSDKYPADTIIRILQPGYQIASRILRPAMVIVSSGKSKKEIKQAD